MHKVASLVWRFGIWTLLWSIPAGACWQTNRPTAVVYGDYLQGHVFRNGKPLVHSKVVIRGASQELQIEGSTDADGRFVLRQVRPAKYRLFVYGWGVADVDVQPASVKIGNKILKLVSVADGCLSIESES